MRNALIGASALVLAAAVAGCQSESKSDMDSGGASARTSSGSASSGGYDRSSSSSSGGYDRSSPDRTSSQARPAADTANSPAAAAPESGAAVGSATEQQATKLLDETMTYIKENKLDLAEKSLTAAEKLKPQLPTSYGPRIDQARTALDAAKKTGLIGR